MRAQLNEALKQSMRAKDVMTLRTVRLILAAVKDRDIAARGKGNADGIGDAEIRDLLQKMIRQREESSRYYEEAGRLDSVEEELREIAVIRGFLPARLDPDAQVAAVNAVVYDLGASGMRDMGRVMAELKRRYAGQMDFGEISRTVKAALAA
ncbi:MAG: GatB/YqeY domain-containing protein [Alphaproteobacteria bacterium]|nr:GatB/YqeY domain-containing protein [Alphaproteobacteria bacterium]MCY4231613.1 GatB/YqeY domain-containing protein [Alphaproteobacteria bacterium]MCY4320703.1 GatB/YqeY domain-containing protein [Alphaproteobacteria bacterium]